MFTTTTTTTTNINRQYYYLQLYWDIQLLSVGNSNNLFVMDKPGNTDPHDLNCLHQSTNPNTFILDSGSSQSCITNTDSLQVCVFSVTDLLPHGGRCSVHQHFHLFYLCHTQMRKKELYGNVKRLKKATRKCWAR